MALCKKPVMIIVRHSLNIFAPTANFLTLAVAGIIADEFV
jgi:hypothetical protein